MDVILCHQFADYDTFGAAVGAARLYPGSVIVLAGGTHASIQDFVSLHRNHFPLVDLKTIDPSELRTVVMVDCHDPKRLGSATRWLDHPQVNVHVYDHHTGSAPDLPIAATQVCLDPVGSTCTLMVEQLQQRQIKLDEFEVMALALGLHADTGSLTFANTTQRDAEALVWLMAQGLNLDLMRGFLEGSLTSDQQALLSDALHDLGIERIRGCKVGSWLVTLPEFMPGLSGLVMTLMELTGVDVLIVAAQQGSRLSLIGRSRQHRVHLHTIMARYGGGGHAQAAAVTIRLDATQDPQTLLQDVLRQVAAQIPPALTAGSLMSSPVRTVRPEITIAEAQRVLLRYGHSGVVVVNEQTELVGVISKRDVDIALHHGFGHAPVKGYMTTSVKTIEPSTPLATIRALMLKWDIGRLPVLDRAQLVGIVTRTDVLRHLHGLSPEEVSSSDGSAAAVTLETLTPRYQEILQTAADQADHLGVQLYLVGGAVRDLLLGRHTDDLDLVADGPYPLTSDPDQPGWGVKLAQALRAHYPEARLEIHGKFQTAALIWSDDLWIDIATARTEFYPYPAAPPEVSLGSIQQDLYRRDFTINALALRLNGDQAGTILDFFGGLDDLQDGILRVLHPNSFLEDPTRIYRGVRFAVRLNFKIDPRTQAYMEQAMRSGIHDGVGGDRLKNELRYILDSKQWPQALTQLHQWGALRCIHPDLHWHPNRLHPVRQAGSWTLYLQRWYPELTHHDVWQLRIETLISPLPNAAMVARQLHLTQAGIDRLAYRPELLRILQDWLATDREPSTLLKQLQAVKVQDIILTAVQMEREGRRILLRYLSDWRLMKPLLDGHHLKQMGYKPGRHFQTMLFEIQKAQLQGRIRTTEEAYTLIQSQFPLAGS